MKKEIIKTLSFQLFFDATSKLLAADQIVVGSIGKAGNRFIFNVKMLQVATGEAINSVYNIYMTLDDLIDGCEDIAYELANSD
jgi:hypothetical protein